VLEATELLAAGGVDLTRGRARALLDAACARSFAQMQRRPPSAAADAAADAAQAAMLDEQQEQQQRQLQLVYDSLRREGALRGYGSVSSISLLPAADVREVSTEEQLRLTGLPTASFAPRTGSSAADLVAGAGSALLISVVSDQLGLDVRLSIGVVFLAFVLDRILLRGAVLESATRLLKPGYAATVRKHEAGHFLVAYLLGCPIEACLLDVWSAARDNRFAGAAGTVFFDPELGKALAQGSITREIIDRYSVVVMAGIAAEAATNGKAEGGQADELALIQLLGSLGGGKSWDLPRVRNQARWAASQALLLLREHNVAYQALCDALSRGEGVGASIAAIEDGLDEQFGRNGELPAQLRARKLVKKDAGEEKAPRTESGMQGPGSDALDARRQEIDDRLKAINERLAREEHTWT